MTNKPVFTWIMSACVDFIKIHILLSIQVFYVACLLFTGFRKFVTTVMSVHAIKNTLKECT